MKTKEILFGEDATNAILAGVNKICDAVKVSLGVKGNTVAMGTNSYHDLTKDGYTISKYVNLSDPREAWAANVIKEVASNTVDEAGDNTTTAMVLAQAIINEGFRLIKNGSNPISITKGINKAVDAVVAKVKDIALPIKPNSEQLLQIATISANNDLEIGKHVAKLISQTGANGAARIDESQNGETYIKLVEGLELNTGWTNKLYITNQDTFSVQYENPLILLSTEKISTLEEAKKILSVRLDIANKTQTNPPIILITPMIEDEPLMFFLANRTQRGLPICIIKADGYGETQKDILEDLQSVLGGKLISDVNSIRAIDTKVDYFGTCDKILVTSTNTTILGGGGDKKLVSDRIEFVRKDLANSTNDFDKKAKEQRLARLEGKVGVIYVGATSESELKEKKDRVDDSIRSSQAALLEGIVAGGGVTGIRCIPTLEKIPYDNKDEKLGISIIAKALEAPYLQMRANAGFEDKKGLAKLFQTNDSLVKNADISAIKALPLNGGYNFKIDKYENLVESGVIDAAKAFRCALQNAASVASTLLTCKCVVVQEDIQLAYNNQLAR